ncbi:unnamed protein product, partial [Schistosoma mattheei]
MLLYFGHEDENAPHTQGVALMLSKVARNPLVEWESHGSRIIKALFKTKKEGITMNIIQCYAPTNDSNDDIKDQFYERLQSIIEKCPRKDLTILMGDLNAKVGIDNSGYEDIKVTTNMLHLLFKKIWEEEQVPMDWNEGYIIKIPKKGDLSKCENYRGITL